MLKMLLWKMYWTQVLKNTGYKYQIIDRQVLIKTASDNLLFRARCSTESRKLITGVILDVIRLEPVIGANVVEKGTTNGTDNGCRKGGSPLMLHLMQH